VNSRYLILAVLPVMVLLVVTRCGTVTAVTPLHRGESALGVSLGGPVADLAGMNIPVPYAAARYRHGLNDRAGLYAGVHLLPAALGVVGVDFGFSYHFLEQRGWVPCVGTSAGVAAFFRPGGGAALFPQLDVVASHRFGDKFTAYVGSQSMYQFRTAPAVVLAPFVGGQFKVSDPLSFGLEAKWYAPTEPTHPRNVDYKLPIANHGAVGFVLGANWLFGGNHE